MIGIKNIKKIFQGALDSNDKTEMVELFSRFQDAPDPETIHKCAEVARDRLSTLEPLTCNGTQYYVSESDRSLGDCGAAQILHAQEVCRQWEQDMADMSKAYKDRNSEQIFNISFDSLINETRVVNRWPAYCMGYFKEARKFLSALQPSEVCIDIETVQNLMEIVSDFVPIISTAQCPLRIMFFPYRQNKINASYMSLENVVAMTAPRKIRPYGSPKHSFLHEIGHAVHRNIVYPEASNVPVASFLPVYNMMYSNPLESIDDRKAFKEHFAEAFSIAVSIGHDDLLQSPELKKYDQCVVQVFGFYFKELAKGNDNFWNDKRIEGLFQTLCDYDHDRSRERYLDVAPRLLLAIQEQAKTDMKMAEALYDIYRRVYEYHCQTKIDPPPLSFVLEQLKDDAV